jgi:hypothetical protein
MTTNVDDNVILNLVALAENSGVEALNEDGIEMLDRKLRALRKREMTDEDADLSRRIAGVLGVTNESMAKLQESVPETDEPPICWCGRHYVGADCPTPARSPSVVADELRSLSYAERLQGFDDHPDRLLREAAYLLGRR